jgi:hypothetical protein
MLRFVQHDKTEDVIPNAVRNPVWMLHFVQHDKSGKRGCFASLSMTNQASVDASLRSA